MPQMQRHIMFSALSRFLTAALLVVSLAFPSAAAADCYVHYKAKRQTPYGLHYGIVQLSGCPSSPAGTVMSRIASGGWELLGIVKVTTSPPTSSERRSAGSHYYR